MTEKGKDGESLETRAKRLEKEAESFSRHIKSTNRSKEETKADSEASIFEELGILARFSKNVRNTLGGVWDGVLEPVYSVVAPPILWITGKYSAFWSRFAYKGLGEERMVSRSRAGFLVGATLVTLLAFTPTKLGEVIRFFTVEPVVDGAMMLSSKTTGEFYLNHTQEIDPDHNVHSVRGCNSLGQCREEDSVYFRVRPRLAHDIWKTLNYGDPFYIPDHVVAPIAPGVNKCQVTYYGYRLTTSWISRLMRSMQVYPIMLEAECEFISTSGQAS
jgi:hypothetical protein